MKLVFVYSGSTTVQGGTPGSSINLQATLQALQAQTQVQNQAATTTPAAGTAATATTPPAAATGTTVITKPGQPPTVVVKAGTPMSPPGTVPQVRLSSPTGMRKGVVQVTKPSPDLLVRKHSHGFYLVT